MNLILPFFLFIITINPTFGQGNGSAFDIAGLASALTSAGFTQLANYTSRINQTNTGQRLISQLSQGNFTLFAPTDQAFANISSNVTGDNEILAKYISYHFVHGDLRNSSYTNTTGGSGGGGATSSASTQSVTSSAASSASSASSGGGPFSSMMSRSRTRSEELNVFNRPVFQSESGGSNGSSGGNLQLLSAIYPNATLGRTLLNSSDWVRLPYDEPQALAWARPWENGNVTILNQFPNVTAPETQNITVINATEYQNIFINGINNVLTPPANVSAVLTNINATQFQSVLGDIPLPSGGSNETTNISTITAMERVGGITAFIPSNDAFSAAQQEIQGLKSNESAMGLLAAGHFTEEVLYTPLLWQRAAKNQSITASTGEPISVIGNSSGLYVATANGTSAKIIRPDILTENGVMHVIDRVLLFSGSFSPSVASSIAKSATSAASASATGSTETGIIGGTVTSAAATQSSPVSGSSSAVSSTPSSSGSAATSVTVRYRRHWH